MLDFRRLAICGTSMSLPPLDNSANAKTVNKAAWDLRLPHWLRPPEPAALLATPLVRWGRSLDRRPWNGQQGTLSNILFSFENGRTRRPGSRIIGDWGDPYGTAASITVSGRLRAHGGSFQWNTMTLTGCTSVSGIAVTVANAANWWDAQSASGMPPTPTATSRLPCAPSRPDGSILSGTQTLPAQPQTTTPTAGHPQNLH